jgi:hypothetical protein
MAILPCNFIIPGGTNNKGGRLQGTGFGGNTPPTLNPSDSLTITVQWGGSPQSAPSSLTGHLVFSPAASNQTAPSPFLDGVANYMCYQQYTVGQDAGNGPVTFTFPNLVYGGNVAAGSFELTFVAEQNTNTTAAIQWSEDPEFDTSN